QHADFGAAEDHGFGAAGAETGNGLDVDATRVLAHDAEAQLLVDDAVEVGDAHVGNQHLEPARLELLDVEALFHCEAGAEQADGPDAVGEQRVGGGRGNVDHRCLEVPRDARVADVHGVG